MFLIRLLSAIVWLPFLLLWLILWPFGVLYNFVLCVIATQALVKKGQNVLFIHNSSGDRGEYLARLQELGLRKGSPLVLDYANHKNWSRWSLPTRLFWSFGPIPKPDIWIPHYLPAVLVLRKFRRPKTFSFGKMSKDPNLQFERLISELKED